MSNKPETNIFPGIVFASKESRELFRIRNSFTFNLGLELIRCVKNPFRLFFFPFRIVTLLLATQQILPDLTKAPKSGFTLIGIDRTGDHFSKQAELLALTIKKAKLGDVTLLNNSISPSHVLEGIQWYRIPAVREKNKSRKEWNLMTERLLSSTLSISQPSHVIYFGDYLYRGVADALDPLDSSVPITWFHSKDRNQLNGNKLNQINPILMPELSNGTPTSQSIHRILRRSESESILLTDIAPHNTNLIESVIKQKNNSILTAIQREYPLPKDIDLVVRMKEVAGMQLEGKITLIIDDESPLLSSLPTLKAPCLLLRTGRKLSPIIEQMVRDLEIKGSLVVVRRNTTEAITYSLQYLNSISEKQLNPARSDQTSTPNQSHYVLKWLKDSTQSYN